MTPEPATPGGFFDPPEDPSLDGTFVPYEPPAEPEDAPTPGPSGESLDTETGTEDGDN